MPWPAASLNPVGETRLRVAQRIPAGSVGHALEHGTAARIFTGAPVPPGADAVVMQEDCTLEGDVVIVRKAPRPGENIRRAGEDIAAGSEVLSAGMRIRPQEMGLVASIGLADVPVYRKLRVALFFTGDEIVMPGEPLEEGEIYNSNRYTLLGLLEGMGCRVADYGIVPDNLAATVDVLKQAWHEADLIVTSGGVSVGEEDHVKAAVESLGKLDMWKVAMKPGKPIAYGTVHDTPFIGLPGTRFRPLPPSACLCGPIFCAAREWQRSRRAATCCPPPSTGVSPAADANSCVPAWSRRLTARRAWRFIPTRARAC